MDIMAAAMDRMTTGSIHLYGNPCYNWHIYAHVHWGKMTGTTSGSRHDTLFYPKYRVVSEIRWAIRPEDTIPILLHEIVDNHIAVRRGYSSFSRRHTPADHTMQV